MISIEVMIKDSGIGMSQDQVDKLFERFTQADNSTTRKYGGTGLGMPISLQLAKLMGGSISVTSSEGKGSIFSLHLNLEKSKEAYIYSKDSADLQRDFQVKVLVVEDNKVNQKVIKKILFKLGIETDLAENGQEALDMFDQTKHRLILMDIQMPVMDGIEATRKLIQQGCPVPILAMTANAFDADRQIYLSEGMQALIVKPIVRSQLVKTLDLHLTPEP
jgi:CheY-like chemotaxis protein